MTPVTEDKPCINCRPCKKRGENLVYDLDLFYEWDRDSMNNYNVSVYIDKCEGKIYVFASLSCYGEFIFYVVSGNKVELMKKISISLESLREIADGEMRDLNMVIVESRKKGDEINFYITCYPYKKFFVLKFSYNLKSGEMGFFYEKGFPAYRKRKTENMKVCLSYDRDWNTKVEFYDYEKDKIYSFDEEGPQV